MNAEFRLGLIGPDPGIPCGISDYVQTLLPALKEIVETEFLPYSEASNPNAPSRHSALLVHYERSRVPHPDFLRDLARTHPAVFVVPHEVYDQDPFAFPVSQLQGTFLTLPLKRLLYAWRHRAYGREVRLQKNGYHARGIFPLNRGGMDILKRRSACSDMTVIPHAKYPPPETPKPADGEREFVLGLFGFLTPAHDYTALLDALAESPECRLLMLGGARKTGGLGNELRKAISTRKLDHRVTLMGHVPERGLGAALASPDAFVFPARFKSSSGSLLRLLDLGKPILAADIPLTRELREEGAPLILYRGKDELGRAMESIRTGKTAAEPNRYAHTFASVARAYVDRMRAALSS